MIPIVIQSGDPECRLSTALWRALRPFHSTALIARERIAASSSPPDFLIVEGSPARNPQTRDRCGGNCLPTGAKGRGPKWTARHYLRPFRQRYYHSFQQHCRQPSDQPATGDHQLLRRPSGAGGNPPHPLLSPQSAPGVAGGRCPAPTGSPAPICPTLLVEPLSLFAAHVESFLKISQKLTVITQAVRRILLLQTQSGKTSI